MKRILFLDFESYYDGKQGYDLRKLDIVRYVRDERFKAFGFAYAFADNPEGPTSVPVWIGRSQTANFCSFIENEIGWSNIALVGHNIKFDAFILRERYGITAGQYICTKAMSKAVLAKSVKGHSLRDLAEHFGLEAKGQLKADGLRDLTPEQENELASYCIHDVELCRDIYTRLAKEFPESQYAPMHRTIDMFVSPKLVLNVPLLEKTAKEEGERRENIFKNIGIEKAEFASNPKFANLLKGKGYEVPTKLSPRTGKTIPAFALGDPEFLELAESENEELKALCEARIAAKSTLLETRSAKLAAIGRTGAWPFDVEFSGADQTHRFSGGSGAGGNPQNFTRDSALREAVEAPKGYSLVVGDFSQVEFRIVAYLSGDPGLIGLIKSGVDFYCDYASSYYGRKITKADDAQRRFGKEALLGLGYNMGADKFKTRIKIKTGQVITKDESWKAVNLYRTRYPYVPKLWEKLGDFIPVMTKKNAHLSAPGLCVTFVHEGFLLPSGLKVRFPNLRQEPDGKGRMEWVYDTWKKRRFEKGRLYGGKLLENISQGLAGDLCKLAMDKMGGDVTGQVHDELHVVCKKGLEQMTVQKLKRAMSVSPSWMPAIKLEAEVGWGKTWGGAK